MDKSEIKTILKSINNHLFGISTKNIVQLKLEVRDPVINNSKVDILDPTNLDHSSYVANWMKETFPGIRKFTDYIRESISSYCLGFERGYVFKDLILDSVNTNFTDENFYSASLYLQTLFFLCANITKNYDQNKNYLYTFPEFNNSIYFITGIIKKVEHVNVKIDKVTKIKEKVEVIYNYSKINNLKTIFIIPKDNEADIRNIKEKKYFDKVEIKYVEKLENVLEILNCKRLDIMKIETNDKTEIDLSEIKKTFNFLKDQLFILKDDVIELSNDLFEKERIRNTAKAVFMNEFTQLFWEIEGLNTEIIKIKIKIEIKKSIPHADENEVLNLSKKKFDEIEQDKKIFEEQLKNSKEFGDREKIYYLNPKETQEVKSLWRKLLSKTHPDHLNDELKNDPILKKYLAELLKMKEYGEEGYNLNKLLEIETRLEKYEKDKGIEIKLEIKGVALQDKIIFLEDRINRLHKRKREIIDEIEQIEKDEFYKYRDFINHPKKSDEYKERYKKRIEILEEKLSKLSKEYASLFKK